MQDTFKRGFGDRYDGWRVRHVDAVYNVIPFVMRSRLDAQNFFEENIPIENIEHFIREHREDMPDLAFMHVIIAAMVRMIATRPYLNRFVMWNKIYARNHIDIALMIKRRQSNVETNVKPEFEPSATLTDVMNIMNAKVNENIDDDANNSMDKLAGILGYIPAFILRFVIGGLRWLDNIGLMPKGVADASPFHCSAFLTNVGSVGQAGGGPHRGDDRPGVRQGAGDRQTPQGDQGDRAGCTRIALLAQKPPPRAVAGTDRAAGVRSRIRVRPGRRTALNENHSDFLIIQVFLFF